MSAPPNWRTGYEGFERFPRLAFAWEYLRRNERFREVCHDNSRYIRQVGNRFTVIDGRRLKFGGHCLFATSPDDDARSATVFWEPGVCPKVLHLLALPVRKRAMPFIFAESPLHTSLLIAPDGLQHVTVRDGVRTLQLCIRGQSLLHPVTLVFDTAAAPSLFSRQNQSLACFQAYRAGQGFLERHFPADPHAKRLTFVLKALDGWLFGLPQREIALTLYGRERVERDWRDPRENLRDQVRHAIARGRALVERGHCAFLC
ncbi:hypothetical protein FHS83_000895 [Rhizomicrobium palustre]|uniref:DUF2285 domain-containing protein n=1 Tax=Rhizomicrobium palustre TaxID=189966 RepID=A0A846MX65_9PROT|nr:DUF2285 domain-containing protein [Rhizomicrobium palustre]NIK87577.1 hypothetical protein [Rhizomicrobium palustre]